MSRITQHPACEEQRAEDRRSGFTLLEVTVGIVFLAVGFLGFGTFLVRNEAVHEQAAQRVAVTNALRSMAEQIRSTSFPDIAASYQNYSFTVDEVDGAGTVTIFLSELSVSAIGELGFPRDLDGDGNVSNPNVAGNYMLLPIKIEVTWDSFAGEETKAHYFLLSQEE